MKSKTTFSIILVSACVFFANTSYGIGQTNVAADESADLQKRFSTWINERVELKKEQHGFHRGAHEEKLAEKRRMNVPKAKYSSEELTFDDAFVLYWSSVVKRSFESEFCYRTCNF